jgi:hypothetical protein
VERATVASNGTTTSMQSIAARVYGGQDLIMDLLRRWNGLGNRVTGHH